MASDLDPYRNWLGISDPQRPLTHYQLLGLPVGEAAADRIHKALNVCNAALKPHLEGPHSRTARRLLVELESVGNCLLDPLSKARYDATLATTAKSAEATAKKPAAAQGQHRGLQINSAALEDLLDELPRGPALVKRPEPMELERRPIPRRPVAESDSKSALWILWIAVIGSTIPILLLIAYLLGDTSEQATADASTAPASQGSAPPPPKMPQTSRATQPTSVVPVTIPVKDPAPQPGPVQKPVESPQVAHDWLQHFPSAIELPDLANAAINSPTELLRLPQAPRDAELSLALKNPLPTKQASTRAFFQTHPIKDRPGFWAVDYVEEVASKSALHGSGTKRRTDIAQFELSKAFTFTWLSAALECPAAQLRNCVLVVSLSKVGSRAFALRRSLPVQEFLVDLAKAAEQRVIDAPGLPPIDSMQLELLKQSSYPAQGGTARRASRREDLTIDIRNQSPIVQLRMRLGESSGKVSVKLQKLYEASDGDFLPFTNERLANLKRTLPRELERAKGKLDDLQDTRHSLQGQLNAFKAVLARDPTAGVARTGAINTQSKINHVGGQINSLMDRIPRLQSRLTLLQPLEQAAGQLRDMRVDFRIVLLVEDVEVEIASTLASLQG